MQKNLSRWWLIMGVAALAVAGLFALVLVVARAPQFTDMPLVTQLFHEALVVHVDLSVLVWFLSIACMMWSLNAAGARQVIPYIEETALICFALGTLAIALSPLDPRAVVMMSNYIPVIHSPVFFWGLGLLFSGTGLMVAKVLAAAVRKDSNGWKTVLASVMKKVSGSLGFARDGSKKGDRAIDFGLQAAALITAMAGAAFVWSFRQMPAAIDGTQYYELLFWGGGHVLQFTHAQILMVAWWLLARAIKPDFLPSDKILYGLFGIGLAAALATPFAYGYFEVTSQEHRLFFTHMMIAVGGLAPGVLALMLLPSLWRTRAQWKNPVWMVLSLSVFLFLFGGLLGGMIRGQNVVIPAHYHGSIVGITLAFMGVAYVWLPKFGYKDVSRWRLARWQPVVSGLGQFMHVSGLAWSGGYGVLRKTPGGMEAVQTGVKVAMGLMGLGGVLAIIGGLMFVAVAIKAMVKN